MKPLPNRETFTKSIASERITGALQFLFIPLLVFTVLVAPVAAQSAAADAVATPTETPDGGDGSGEAGGLCSTSDDGDGTPMFQYWINTIIQIAIYGGVALGGAMYIGAEAVESRGLLSDQQVETVKNIKRNGLGKIVKLSLIPALLAILVGNSATPMASCIDLVPF